MKTKLITKQWACRFALAGLSLVGLSAFAQDVESLDNGVATPAPVAQLEPSADKSARLPITTSFGLSEQFSADIDKGGSFSITRAKIGVALPVRLNDNFILASTLRYGLDVYDWDKIPDLWDNINTLSASSILTWRDADSAWSYYGGGFIKMSAESGAALNQGTTGGGIIGVSYKFSDELSVGGGLAVLSQIEDSTQVLPIITAKWKFADNWLLNVGLTDVATTGYGADVKWIFSKELDFSFGAQFHRSRFRIDGAGAYQNGVGQEKATTLYADTTWHASPNVDLGAFVGIAGGGNIKVENSSGNAPVESNYDPAAILGVKAALRF